MADKKNNPENIGKRHLFSDRNRRYIDGELLFLDETGFNLHSRRSYGYSPKKSPARLTVRANRGRNVSLMALISKNGFFNYEVRSGSFNSKGLVSFLRSCI